MLKTLIIDNHDNLTILQRAEQNADAEIVHASSQGEKMNPKSLTAPDIPNSPSHNDDHKTSFESEDAAAFVLPVSGASKSGSEDGDFEDRNGNEADHVSSEHKNSRSRINSLNSGVGNNDPAQNSAGHQLSTYSGSARLGTSRTSALLLQMVPFQPRNLDPLYRKSSNRLISNGPKFDTKPALEEATKSLRLLLDKWTISGFAPVAKTLDEKPIVGFEDE